MLAVLNNYFYDLRTFLASLSGRLIKDTLGNHQIQTEKRCVAEFMPRWQFKRITKSLPRMAPVLALNGVKGMNFFVYQG